MPASCPTTTIRLLPTLTDVQPPTSLCPQLRRKAELRLPPVHVGDVVMGKFHKDGLWYRGRVASTDTRVTCWVQLDDDNVETEFKIAAVTPVSESDEPGVLLRGGAAQSTCRACIQIVWFCL